MNQDPKYNLEERTAMFGVNVIRLCRTLKQDAISRSLIDQFVRSATSVGANYAEANGASSDKDFTNKLFICKKEIQESKHWLRMLNEYFPEKSDEIAVLAQEAKELTLIFQKGTATMRAKMKLESLRLK